MVSLKHLISLLVFEVVAILPVILIIYWGKKFAGGFSWVEKSFNKFNYHPVFMIIGFVFVMGHSVISFRILPLGHRTKKYIHASMNLIAAIFVIAGMVTVFQFHAEHEFPDLYSTHSWLGLATVSLFFLQLLGGLSIFQDLVKGANDEVRGVYKPWHVVAGITMVTLVAVSICTGIQEKYLFMKTENFSATAYTMNFLALSIFMWVFTVIYILMAVEKQTPQDEYSVLPSTQEESINQQHDNQ